MPWAGCSELCYSVSNSKCQPPGSADTGSAYVAEHCCGARLHALYPAVQVLVTAGVPNTVARAFRFFLLIKKRSVAWGPMVSDTPARNISCATHARCQACCQAATQTRPEHRTGRVRAGAHVPQGYQPPVKKEHNAQEGEHKPQASQHDADLCARRAKL